MKLYHYSKELRPMLLSKAAAGMPEEQVKLERLNASKAPVETLAYCDHISFFFSPIPAALLPKLFPKDHPVWAEGTQLYEHIVEVGTLPLYIDYMVVESVKRTQLFDQFAEDEHWVSDDPAIYAKWIVLEDEKLRQWGEKGDKLFVLKRKIQENQYVTSGAFIKASRRSDRADNEYKYASCVPHVMLWPPGGKVKPSQINSLVMGKDDRTPVVL